jgi:hypothetical protein
LPLLRRFETDGLLVNSFKVVENCVLSLFYSKWGVYIIIDTQNYHLLEAKVQRLRLEQEKDLAMLIGDDGDVVVDLNACVRENEEAFGL